MSEQHPDAPAEGATTPAGEPDPERQEVAELQDRLDAEADGDGLAAEAGKGEETGLAEG
ncbi:hypothetical protein [Nocardioides sp. SYSU DS0663]|uniref:hypothetical protein n=1 Tax=Nocardioides sp. SYSU DS0663 TaxID=3416445 RepID=UPI003F4C9D0B